MSKKSKEEKAKPILDKKILQASRFALTESMNLGSNQNLDSNFNFGSIGNFSIRSVKISKEKIEKEIFDKNIEKNGK